MPDDLVNYNIGAVSRCAGHSFVGGCVVRATAATMPRRNLSEGSQLAHIIHVATVAAFVSCSRDPRRLINANVKDGRAGSRRGGFAIIRALASQEVTMPYTFTLTATIPASPEEIYEAWLDSLGHSEMTGGEANMSGEVGAEVSAWDGYISRPKS